MTRLQKPACAAAMQRQVPVWIPKTQPRPHRMLMVNVEAKFVDERGTAIPRASASVTLYFRLGAEGTGEAGGLGSESSTEGVGSSPPHASLRRGSLLNLCVARAAFAQDPGDAPAGQGRWGGGKLGGVGEDFRAGCI